MNILKNPTGLDLKACLNCVPLKDVEFKPFMNLYPPQGKITLIKCENRRMHDSPTSKIKNKAPAGLSKRLLDEKQPNIYVCPCDNFSGEVHRDKSAGHLKLENVKSILTNNHWFTLARKDALEKANYKCQCCGVKTKEVHHIDKSRDNHSLSNLLVVCHKCHIREFHSDKQT